MFLKFFLKVKLFSSHKNRYFYGYYWTPNTTKTKPIKVNGTLSHEDIDHLFSRSRRHSNSSSTSTITNANASSGLYYDITDSNSEHKPKSIISSGNRCPNCSRSHRRLSWKTSSSVFKNLSVLQLISLSSDSLNSTVKACEECKEKLVSSGDHNESIDQKLDAILKQLNSLSLELENIKNDCSPLNLFEVFIVIYD